MGDIIDAFMAIMVLRTCQQVEGGLSTRVMRKMIFNITLDFVIGLLPFIGDISDAFFRANTRNVSELERFLREKRSKDLEGQGHASSPVNPIHPDKYDQQKTREDGPPPQYTT
jgi:hypothetical protein